MSNPISQANILGPEKQLIEKSTCGIGYFLRAGDDRCQEIVRIGRGKVYGEKSEETAQCEGSVWHGARCHAPNAETEWYQRTENLVHHGASSNSSTARCLSDSTPPIRVNSHGHGTLHD